MITTTNVHSRKFGNKLDFALQMKKLLNFEIKTFSLPYFWCLENTILKTSTFFTMSFGLSFFMNCLTQSRITSLSSQFDHLLQSYDVYFEQNVINYTYESRQLYYNILRSKCVLYLMLNHLKLIKCPQNGNN